MSYGKVKLTKFMVATALIAHWMACLWHLTRVIEDAECNWVTNYFGSGDGDGCDDGYVGTLNPNQTLNTLYKHSKP